MALQFLRRHALDHVLGVHVRATSLAVGYEDVVLTIVGVENFSDGDGRVRKMTFEQAASAALAEIAAAAGSFREELLKKAIVLPFPKRKTLQLVFPVAPLMRLAERGTRGGRSRPAPR